MATILCPTHGGEKSIPNQERAIAIAKDRGADLIFLYVSDVHFLDHLASPILVDLEAELDEMGQFLCTMASERADKAGVHAQTMVPARHLPPGPERSHPGARRHYRRHGQPRRRRRHHHARIHCRPGGLDRGGNRGGGDRHRWQRDRPPERAVGGGGERGCGRAGARRPRPYGVWCGRVAGGTGKLDV